jgi:hypothetical protein
VIRRLSSAVRELMALEIRKAGVKVTMATAIDPRMIWVSSLASV